MIIEVAGDILLTDAKAIAHGVAPNDHFESGLALSLREQWPAMVKDFRHYAHQTHPKPGEIWEWAGVGGTRIFNLLTQEGDTDRDSKPGKATLTNVNHCLHQLRKEVKKGHIPSLALPRLSTGVGGLDWDDVRPLIQQHLGDLPIPISVYTTFHKGIRAEEPIGR